MHLNPINQLRSYKRTIDAFGGLNLLPEIADNEFSDMKNMSLDEYPVIKSRAINSRVAIFPGDVGTEEIPVTDYTTLFFNETWGYVDGATGDLYFGGSLIAEGFGSTVPGTRENGFAVNMGAYVLFFPEKKYFKVSDRSFGTIYGEFSCTAAALATVGAVFDETTEANSVTFALTAPPNPSKNDIYFYSDNSGCHCFRYNEYGDDKWYPCTKIDYKITHIDLPGDFREGDTVTVENTPSGNFDGLYTVSGVGNGYLIIRETPVHKRLLTLAVSGQNTGYKSGFYGSIKRNVPDIAFACVCGNRVWGCSPDGHEIYASKLGDPFNWNVFEGLSSDSYAATVGSDGAFTGAITYLDHPCFFKEDELIKIYGSKPANFQFGISSINGVKSGAGKTLVCIDDRLYYQSNDGIYVYSGSTSKPISAKIPGVVFYFGGAYRGKYYCATGSKEEYIFDPSLGTFTYNDVKNGLRSYFSFPGGLAAVHKDKIVKIDNTVIVWHGIDNQARQPDTSYESAVEWSLTTKQLSADVRDHSSWDDPAGRHIVGLQIQASGEGYMTVEVQYDGAGEWHPLGTYNQESRGTKTFRFIPRRCERLTLRLSGLGSVKIYSISYGIER